MHQGEEQANGGLAPGLLVLPVKCDRQEVVMGMMKVMKKYKVLWDVHGRSDSALGSKDGFPKNDALKWCLNDE